MKYMILTGERMILGRMKKETEFEHLCRYNMVVDLVKGKVVLDAACGSGYGSNELAKNATKVVGMDISEEAVAYAKEKYHRDNLEYIVGSVETLPFENQSIDVVVSFETIEHVNEDIQNAFLKEIKRVLKPDGYLIMSTPNKKTFTDMRSGRSSEYHVKEFYYEEYRDFLKQEFQYVDFKRQFYANMACMVEENENFTSEVSKLDDEPLYIIAICSNDKTVYNELGQFSYMIRYPREYQELDDYVQIFYSDDNNFDEEHAQLIQINSAKEKQHVQVELDGVKARYVRIDISKNPCRALLINTEIEINGERTNVKPIGDNSIEYEDGKSIFVEDPHYIVDLGAQQTIDRIYLDFEYSSLEGGYVSFKMNSLLHENEQLRNEHEELGLFKVDHDKKEEYINQLETELAAVSEHRDLLEAENDKKEDYILSLQKQIADFSENERKYIAELQYLRERIVQAEKNMVTKIHERFTKKRGM